MMTRMKKLMLMCLLATSAGALAQTRPPDANPRGGKNSDIAELERQDAKADADEAKVRAELDQARQDLDKAAQRVAELSTQLAQNEGRDVFFINTGGPR